MAWRAIISPGFFMCSRQFYNALGSFSSIFLLLLLSSADILFVSRFYFLGSVTIADLFTELDDRMLNCFFINKPCLFIVFVLFCHASWAQASPEDLMGPPTFEQRLQGLHDTLKSKEKERRVLEGELKAENDPLTREQLQQELSAANDIIVGVREEIVILSTGGAKLYSEPPVQSEDFNWQKDLELIFEPLLDQLREITERPRLIEKLETDIDYWQARDTELSEAVLNLEQNHDFLSDNSLKRKIKELLETAKSRSNTTKQKLSLLENELQLLKASRNPIWSTLADIFTNVIVGIVVHFFIAVVSAVFIYQVVRLLSLIPIALVSKNKPRETVFAARAIIVIRTFLGAYWHR